MGDTPMQVSGYCHRNLLRLLLGWYYCERNVIFDDIKRGIWANEQAIQNNTKLIHELYKKHEEAEHK